MREFATEILDIKNIDYRFSEEVTDQLSLSAEQRKNLFLIYKEAINNAAKYSKASLVEISLHQHDHLLVMSIKDNGRGFEEQSTKAGNGLRNLRERAKEINSSLTLTSAIGNGTELELKLPIA
jgi:signal transduction histidine kinase